MAAITRLLYGIVLLTALEAACNTPSCSLNCPYGLKVDDNGCTLCECNEPCELLTCDEDKTCRPNACDFPPCNPPALCIDIEEPYIPKPGLCPRPLPGVAGICVEMCGRDDACPGEEKCCSNGCGHVCMEPCLVFECSLTCPYGLKAGSNKCQVCECIEPCDLVSCAPGMVCQPNNCDFPPCDPPGFCGGL